jgi:signal transduction histidine kinase
MLVDLLTYSRVGRMQEVREVSLSAALDQVLEEIKLPAGFDLVRSLDVDRVIMGERDILTLLDALIQNAIKHHDKPRGRIIVTSARQGDDVVIGVTDDGPGIEEQYRERVFGAMRTLRPRDEVEGSGMGLANVRKIAGVVGGSARLTGSPFGPGTLVEVRVPARALQG